MSYARGSRTKFTPWGPALLLSMLLTVSSPAAANVHTVFTTECGTYFTWQALGMVYSHKKSGQPGKITRLMSCTDEQWASYPDKDLVPTHRAPSFTTNPHNQDIYSAYNKPEAVIDWLAHNEVEEEFVLILDADMIIRRPFIPEELGVKKGLAISAFYGYLKGVNNELAMKHVPEVLPRNDTLAGPKGRRGDQVGGFILMEKSDLRRMSPLWLKYSEDVRLDPDAWKLTGDAYSTHPGDKPWISEMYGYSFGAAKADVWHKYHTTAMIYPGYLPIEPPKILHYGLKWEILAPGTATPSYVFDKHWHYQFLATRCPPWELEGSHDDAKGGLFPHPPRASDFKTSGLKLLRDLLSIEVPLTLNQGFCHHHRQRCPKSAELDLECGKVAADAAELAAAFLELGTPQVACDDNLEGCKEWAASGECTNNMGFMNSECRLSCGQCPKLNEIKKAPVTGNLQGQLGLQPKLVETPTGAVGVTAPLVKPGVKAVMKPDIKGADGRREAKEAAALLAVMKAGRQRSKRFQAESEADKAKRGVISRLSALCTGSSQLSMSEVKACLEAAASGKPYSPGDVAAPKVVADEKVATGKLISGSGKEAGELELTARKLRTETVATPVPAGRSLAVILRNLGGLGLLLWCGTVLLFLFLLPRTRSRGKTAYGSKARKESML